MSRPEFLTPAQLSDRWGRRINVRTLANWRTAGTGPRYVKIGGAISDIATETLATGNEFDIPGVVKMVSVHKEARMGRNPQTGAQIQHPAKVVPRFKASSVLKKALNSR